MIFRQRSIPVLKRLKNAEGFVGVEIGKMLCVVSRYEKIVVPAPARNRVRTPHKHRRTNRLMDEGGVFIGNNNNVPILLARIGKDRRPIPGFLEILEWAVGFWRRSPLFFLRQKFMRPPSALRSHDNPAARD